MFAGLMVTLGVSFIAILVQLNQRISADEQRFRLLAPADVGYTHVDVRLFIIRSQMDQVELPIILLGDSITEAAVLPPTICGHPLINAGIGGMDAETYRVLARSLFDNRRAALFIVALGTNDAAKGSTPARFRDAYISLAAFLKPRADKILFAGIPPITETGTLAQRYFDADLAQQADQTIRAVASDELTGFVDFRTVMSTGDLTLDGVHLNAAGYRLWNAALITAIKASLGCQ